MGKAERACGGRGERGAELTLLSRDWEVQRRQHGDKGDDGTVKDPRGKTHSLEVKNCRTPPFTQWCKAKKTARERGLSLIFMWHPKDWGFSARTWVCFFLEPGNNRIRVWE